ncbi:MAG: hypothetical protein ACI9EW_001158 [Cellvibrionaceae bacterium]|jgi:hypothetical protein
MEIFDQIPILAVIIQYILDGFFLGALAGAVAGASVWTLMERGRFGIVPLSIAAVLGVFVGIYLEGNALRAVSGQEWGTFFNGSLEYRAAVFAAVISILGWMLGVMVIGAIVSSYRLAITGFLVGGIMGTLSGILVLVMGREFGFPTNSPITSIVVTIIAASLIIVVSAGSEKKIK